MQAAPLRDSDGGPWYRYFWPWFIVILLGTAVTASLTTVWIAVVNRDSLVSDDYYEDGLAINRRLELTRSAEQRGVVAEIQLRDPSNSGTVPAFELTLAGEGVTDIDWLTLSLSHPTQSVRDQRVMLGRSSDGRFHGRADEQISGRWYASLEPAPLDTKGRDGSTQLAWRLDATIRLPSSTPIVMGTAAKQGGLQAIGGHPETNPRSEPLENPDEARGGEP